MGINKHYTEENELIAFKSKKFNENSIFFDIGCNIGTYTQLILDNLKLSNFSVHSFEPLSIEFFKESEQFKNNLNVHLNNIALSDKMGISPFYSVDCSGLSSLTFRKVFNDFGYKIIDVSVSTLDIYVLENNIEHIDWMKIDVEGFEFNVLQGGKEMLKKGMVDIIQFEYGDCTNDNNITMDEIINYMKSFEYELYEFYDNEFSKLKNFTNDYSYNNYYFIKKKYN